MGIFKRYWSDKPVQPSSTGPEVLRPVYQPTTTAVSVRPASIGEMDSAKDTVEHITQELKINADQQQIAAKRMAGLLHTIAKMESGQRHMERLEAQCAKLENDLTDLQKQHAQKENWGAEQERKLINLRKQHSKVQQELEIARVEIMTRSDREKKNIEGLAAQKTEIDGLNTVAAEHRDHINSLSMTNTNLQDDVSAQSVVISQQKTRAVELQKSLEEVALRLDRKTKSNSELTGELGTLRTNHNTLKTQYFEKTSALEHAEYDIKTQRSVLEDSLKRRDAESYALKTRIEQLNTQVRIKENMSGHLDEEILSLRAAVDSERARIDRVERRLRDKTNEADKASAALAHTKADYDALNAKFDKLMHDLDSVRRINYVQKQKLERYSSIAVLNATTSENPTVNVALRGGTGSRNRYSRDYDIPSMPTKTPSNIESDILKSPIRDIKGRKKI